MRLPDSEGNLYPRRSVLMSKLPVETHMERTSADREFRYAAGEMP